ncbi:c-type cytochrome [Aegicerativicinus sediminis]|uniref:c-type cytochrome n=1 Tax=Aegicerativicinus sediminis TaxID=2893202 RepID=UPI001E5FBD46|nr:cytochrome c [Aegicerativicinus sediminis]
MKNLISLSLLIFLFIFSSCGGGATKKEEKSKIKLEAPKSEIKTTPKTEGIPPSQRVDLDNKGVGPITSLKLSNEIDPEMAAHGEEVYKNMCSACHRPDKKFIGPAPIGILERRSPEWIMNMILAPEKMVQNDPLAKDLLMEFNGSPMANQNLTEEEARAVLEYFRTLK